MIGSGRTSACTAMCYVIRAHVGHQQTPVAICAALHQGGQNSLTAASIHTIRRLVHRLPLRQNPLPIRFDQTAQGQTMLPIHRTRFIAVQVAAVTSECNRVIHQLMDSTATAPTVAAHTPYVWLRAVPSLGETHPIYRTPAKHPPSPARHV